MAEWQPIENQTGTNQIPCEVSVYTCRHAPVYDAVYDIDEGGEELLVGLECDELNGFLAVVKREAILKWARDFVQRHIPLPDPPKEPTR